ncbi:MAG: S9 family peptidase [Simkaniaceae bacterium]|nr:S9 family peptidase [Simkaniaceae bacterium]
MQAIEWPSPITSDLITQQAITLTEIEVDDHGIYWIERRPNEKGRCALVKEGVGEVSPKQANVRTPVHEYGGGAYCVQKGEGVFFDFKEKALFSLSGEKIDSDWLYADFAKRDSFLFAVGEKGDENCLILVGKGAVHQGHDFYASPVISPNGAQLAWITWDHPNMPWDSSDLWVADIQKEGTLSNICHVAGGDHISVMEPKWAPDGTLYFLSDEKNGFWNLMTLSGPLSLMEADIGSPHWIFGEDHYAFYKDQIAAVYTKKGVDHLVLIDRKTGKYSPVDLPFVTIRDLHSTQDKLVFLGTKIDQPTGIYTLQDKELTLLKTSQHLSIDEGYLSTPQHITFPTTGGKEAYGFYYSPKNKDIDPSLYTTPPLIVMSHGGPTSQTTAAFNLKIQFWTSRGFAVLDVNYGGSSGYGRLYRERLKGNWGIVDVDDCANGALYLAKQGLVDPKRLYIRGSSAGGYTTLAALTFKDVFAKGASYYGIADLEALALHTHKFEAHYTDGLIGPYPKERQLYLDRSPIHHIDQLSCPVILFQGEEDRVVPKEQAEMMFNALKTKGIKTEYHLYPGEQHGFRMAEHIKASLEAELLFYTR